MKVAGRIALFVLRAVATAALGKVGEHIGDAVGPRIAKRFASKPAPAVALKSEAVEEAKAL